ncbi:hypothetical protein BOO69_03780 [Sulfitobacter alexandrii]|uniref:HTH araC/xylS-type domain-containing protein n=1 Tax=Sulfitobacter alexandrii TaxID=1917485 RepID=A0A1J0WE90_9RHOB|nr:AraC family transcriptional regulator [Sulfitobacter alexandrii]APE42637.1 hypothetical protein BOO69_03780 [Sulfitobacter alexandrii]
MTQPTDASAFADHADFYRRGPYARYMIDRKIVGQAPVSLFSARQPAGHFPDPAMPNVLLYLATRGTREAQFDWGCGRWVGPWRSQDLTLVPPDTASDVTLSGPHAFIGLCLPVSLFDGEETCARERLGRLGPLYAAPFRDDLLLQLCTTLWREGEDSTGYSLFADSALHLVVDRLTFLAQQRRTPERGDRLSPAVLKSVDDYINEGLDGTLRVADLAKVAGMGTARFARLFRQTTGRTVYAHVLALRVARAQERIAMDTTAGLAEIALDCGFSSQSHMTSVFRQVTGRTPGGRR